MDCASSDWEYKTLINELTQGMEQANQLKLHLNSTSSPAQQFLLQKILDSYEKALLILKWSGNASLGQPHPLPPPSTAIKSSLSVDGSPRSEELRANFRDHQVLRDVSKKRKTSPTRTEQVKVSSENGLEGPGYDGNSWRKYGQKDILGAKYPRSYYRCTYRHIHDCWATKQVQRSDDDPSVFDITYKGSHACNQSTNNLVASPASPEKQEMKHSNNYNNYQTCESNQILMNFRNNLKVNIAYPENMDSISPFSFPSKLTFLEGENQILPISTLVDENFLGAYSPSFISPATSGSNYFSMSTCDMNSLRGAQYLQHSESDITEIVSATASTTNSPIGRLDFPLDPSDFPFNSSGFFT